MKMVFRTIGIPFKFNYYIPVSISQYGDRLTRNAKNRPNPHNLQIYMEHASTESSLVFGWHSIVYEKGLQKMMHFLDFGRYLME
jgi:hypothetical protein